MVLGGIAAVWTIAIMGWRWSRRRLGLDTLDAPGMSQREKAVRRSLRSLLAFDFLLWWPVTIPFCVLATVMIISEGRGYEMGLAIVASLVGFTVPVPVLVRMVRQLEQQRLAGRADTVPPSVFIEGGQALLSPQRSRWARWAGYAALVVMLVVGVMNWQLALALAFYAGIFWAARLGWSLLTRLWRA